MFMYLGQPGYSILSRLGKYSNWLYLYNDNVKKQHIKSEYHWSLKFSLYFFFKYSAIFFKNHWINYFKYFNTQKNTQLKTFKKKFISSINWVYKISLFTMLTKSSYTFNKFKPIIIDSDVYVISFKNFIFIYWFWGKIKFKKQKFKKQKFKKQKFKKQIAQFVYIIVYK